jgi:hypothetical protein
MTNWWEVDTSATIRVTCKVCGVVREVESDLATTGGAKVLELEGFCDKHERGSGIGEGEVEQ